MEELVSKLKSPILEIRIRALENIAQKLKHNILKLDELVEKTDCCAILTQWFSDKLDDGNVISKSTLPELPTIIRLLSKFLEDSVNGKQILAQHNLKAVLQSWLDRYRKYQDLSVVESIETILIKLNHDSDEKSDTQPMSSYGCGASVKSSILETPNDDFLAQRNLSLPPHLLEDQLKRTLSPVTRSYIKRVTFVTDHELDEFNEADKNFLTVLPSPFQWSPLSKLDREKLRSIHSALTSHKPEVIRDACIELQSDVFDNFPAEVFIQRPDLVFGLQDVILINPNYALKALAAQALGCLCRQLVKRWLLCLKHKSSRKDNLLSITASNHHDETNLEPLDEDESFADQINTTQLKKLQLNPFEFCLMSMSTAASALQNASNLRAVNALNYLFECGLDMVPIIVQGQVNYQQEAYESLNEIENDLLKCLMIQQKENRVIYLLCIKLALKFMDIMKREDSGLSAFLDHHVAYDPTLMLSHKHLHDRIKCERFNAVEEVMCAMKHSVKVFLKNSVPKVDDLKKALPALLYHGNHKAFIPIVVLVARSARDRDQARQVSSVLTQLMTFPDEVVRSETLFQMHSLVQEILGVGQALDIDGTKKLDLSFMILDRGEIVLELLKIDDPHLSNPAIEIVLYLLKSEHIFGGKLWKVLNEEVLKPNLALIETKVDEDQTNLIRWIQDKYSKSSDTLLALRVNLRLLLTSKNTNVRREAQSNTKTLISRQENSETKLPRFSHLIKMDLTEKLTSGQPAKLNTRRVQSSCHSVSVKDLLDLINLSPSYDVVTKKNALEELRLVLETADAQQEFALHKGYDLLIKLMDECLEESNQDCIDILPAAIDCLSVLLILDPELKNVLKEDLLLLFILTRSLYLLSDGSRVVTCLSLILFNNWLEIQDSLLTLPKVMTERLNFPIQVISVEKKPYDIIEVPEGALGLLKVYWNLAWFGGIHILSEWTTPMHEPQFSSKLNLDPSELTLIKNSFSEATLEKLTLNLNKSKTHGDFHDGLQLASAHVQLLESSDKIEWVSTLPWHSAFSRFFLAKPHTRNDEKLFLAIVEFLTSFFKAAPSAVEKFEETIVSGKSNLIDLLVRDEPKTGMDLLLKGHEKVGAFLMATKPVKGLESYLAESIRDNDLNAWSLKVLLKYQLKLNNDHHTSRLLRIVLNAKTSIFNQSSRILYSLMILNNHFLQSEPPKNLNWLNRILSHRIGEIRVLGYQICMIFASTGNRANLLAPDTKLWQQFIDVVLDRSESCQAREFAMATLTNLLKLSAQENAFWFGPTMREGISGIRLTGEASMSPFLASVNFEESTSRLFHAFGSSSKNLHLNDESVHQHSITSSETSHLPELEEAPSESLVASILDFLVQIIKMDTAPQDDKFSSLPLLKSRTFPAALRVAQDVSSRSGDEDLSATMTSLCNFFSIALANFDWAFSELVANDRCVCLAMLISTFHNLDLSPDSLLTTLALVVAKDKGDASLFQLVHKYRGSLLEMALKAEDCVQFCSVLFIYLHRERLHVESAIDDWDPKLVESLAKVLMVSKDKAALKNMFLVSSIAQEVVLEEKQVLSHYVDALEKMNSKTVDVIDLLNNFSFKNPAGQQFLCESFTVHKKIVILASKAMSQLIVSNPEGKKTLVVLLCKIISLVSTLTACCPEAKSCMASNVGLERGKASSILQVLVELIVDDSFGQNMIRSRIIIPNAFRILTACMTSVECRSWLIRSPKFLSVKCIQDLDNPSPDPIKETLWLDLLLSLTTFPDGQIWLAKNNDIIDVLVGKATHSDSLPSLAILRNLSFNSGARKKLLLLPNFLALLTHSVSRGQRGIKLRLALASIWALSANCHKAKVTLGQAGIPKQLEQLLNEDCDDAALIASAYTVLTSYHS